MKSFSSYSQQNNLCFQQIILLLKPCETPHQELHHISFLIKFEQLAFLHFPCDRMKILAMTQVSLFNPQFKRLFPTFHLPNIDFDFEMIFELRTHLLKSNATYIKAKHALHWCCFGQQVSFLKRNSNKMSFENQTQLNPPRVNISI